jgi:hypothetical protein
MYTEILDVIKNIGVFTVASGFLLFVFKQLIEKYLNQVFEMKNRILDLEEHKSRVRFTSLQNKQFEVISELYVNTLDLIDEINEYFTWLGFDGHTPEEKQKNYTKLYRSMSNYGADFKRKRLFI